MNLFLSLLSGILSLIVLALIVAVFLKKEYGVVREININMPKKLVFDYLKHLKNQDNFSKWASMDPNMKKEFRGTDATVGFVQAWESDHKNVGTGEQEIKKITEGKQVDFQLRFIKPFAGIADVYMSTDSVSTNETKVKWGFKSKMKYPMNLMLVFMNMDRAIGNDFETGLTKLKRLLEE